MLTHNELEEPVVQQLEDLEEVDKVQVRLGSLLARPAGLNQPQSAANGYTFCGCALSRQQPCTSKGNDSSTEVTAKELLRTTFQAVNPRT